MQKWILVVVMVYGFCHGAFLQTSHVEDATEREIKAAVEKSLQVGPAQINLIDQGSLSLSNHYRFVPLPAAARLRAIGDAVDDRFIGLILPTDHNDRMVMSNLRNLTILKIMQEAGILEIYQIWRRGVRYFFVTVIG